MSHEESLKETHDGLVAVNDYSAPWDFDRPKLIARAQQETFCSFEKRR